MTTFNGKKLQGAKNINNVSTEVGIVFMRAAGSDGKFDEVPSTSNVNLNFDPTNIVDLRSESRGTAAKVKQDQANLTFDLTENASLEFISEVLGLEKTSVTAGAETITDREMTFSDEDLIEFRELSNDGLGVTNIVVASTDGVTTYVLDTDYEVVLDGNITRIKRLDTGAITAGETVLVSGEVNLNAQERATFIADYAQLKEVEVRVAFEKKIDGVYHYRIYDCRPMTLNSTYTLPFLNAVEAGGAQNTSLQFDLSDSGEISVVNEII